MTAVQFNDGGKSGTLVEARDATTPEARISRNFKSSNPNHTYRYAMVFFEDMVIDPRIQRGEETSEINLMVANWNPAALGTVTLSKRTDGTMVVLDGQQRRASGLKVDYKEQVPSIVHEGLTLAEEAALFLLLNTRRSVNSWTQFRIARTAGDPVAQAIGLILDELNIPLGGPKGFSAVVMARRVARRQGGLTHLQWALRQVQKIYDTTGEGGVYDGRVIEALAMLYREYGPKIHEDELHKKLVRHGSGVAGINDLIGHGHTIQKLDRCRISKAIARAIAARYNISKPKDSKHALPIIP